MNLLESLLGSKELVLPSITVLDGGLSAVNVSEYPLLLFLEANSDNFSLRFLQSGLDHLRAGKASLSRVVIQMQEGDTTVSVTGNYAL